MSLIKQLWLAISGLMIVVFVSSFLISALSAKAYYQQELSVKNNDNANSLALILTQMDKDPVMVELFITAQFDTGNYQKISLIDPNDQPIFERSHPVTSSQTTVPDWFVQLFPLVIEPGIAHISNGWQQYGVLTIFSDDRNAYESLWVTTLDFFIWFLGITLLIGIVATWLLKRLIAPLGHVVEQAEALQAKRFISSPVPKTLEFKKLVQAMNSLTARIKTMLEKDRQRLEALRFKTQYDGLTGLANRHHFLHQFDALLADEERVGKNILVLVRVSDLVALNQKLGRQSTDKFLKSLALALKKVVRDFDHTHSECYWSRLNGSDFAVLLGGVEDYADFLASLSMHLEVLGAETPNAEVFLPTSVVEFSGNAERGKILQSLDGLIAEAELHQCQKVRVQSLLESSDAGLQGLPETSEGWRKVLDQAIQNSAIYARYYPVKKIEGEMLHSEAMMRLQTDTGDLWPAGYFLPWAKRMGVLPSLDLVLLQKVLETLESAESDIESVALNVSIDLLKDVNKRCQFLSQLKSANTVCYKLWIEISESVIISDMELFNGFVSEVKALGCKVGLDHAGSGLSKLEGLQELGLDFLKIDASLTKALFDQADQEDQEFVRSLCRLGHSLSMVMIAEGVAKVEDVEVLKAAGFDAVTGPGVL